MLDLNKLEIVTLNTVKERKDTQSATGRATLTQWRVFSSETRYYHHS